jgi:hypothetical protein
VGEFIHDHEGTGRSVRVLPGGETLEIDGSTIIDPETGQPAPAAVLRLPVWRLTELAAALAGWTDAMALFNRPTAQLPDETELSQTLQGAATALAYPLQR